MKEHSLAKRLVMIARVIVSIVSWVVLILIKIVRNMLPLGANTKRGQVDSGTTRS